LNSGRESFAAFGSAGVDDCASAAGFHAHQKSMGTGSACFRGLVCAFHDKNLWFEGKPCIISVFTWFLKEFLFESANLSNKLTETDEKTLFLWINF
jgi:hypothetical protein